MVSGARIQKFKARPSCKPKSRRTRWTPSINSVAEIASPVDLQERAGKYCMVRDQPSVAVDVYPADALLFERRTHLLAQTANHIRPKLSQTIHIGSVRGSALHLQQKLQQEQQSKCFEIPTEINWRLVVKVIQKPQSLRISSCLFVKPC